MFLHCIAYRIQTSVSGCNDHTRLTIIGRCNLCDNSIVLFEVYFLEFWYGSVIFSNLSLKIWKISSGWQLFMLHVGNALCRVAHCLAHLLRQLQSVMLLQNIAYAAFSGLAVDSDDIGIRSVRPTSVRVERQIRYGPVIVTVVSPRGMSYPSRWHPGEIPENAANTRPPAVRAVSGGYLHAWSVCLISTL